MALPNFNNKDPNPLRTAATTPATVDPGLIEKTSVDPNNQDALLTNTNNIGNIEITTQVQGYNQFEDYEISQARAYGMPVPTQVGRPADTATNSDGIVPPTDTNTQSVGPLGSMDSAFFGVGDVNGVVEGAKQQVYDNAVQALSPIGNTLSGAANAIVGTANAVVNTFTSTVNSVVGAITDVISGKILTDAVSGLMSTAEKFIATVGQAAYQNVMGFLESFKTIDGILNAAGKIANDIGQNIKQIGNDLGKLLSLDMDKLSWPSINWDRVKSCFDTETFTKMGTSIGNFLGNIKLPIGLSMNQIKDLTANLDLKEQLLKQVEDVRNGVTQIGTSALNNLYGQLSAVNNAILSITNLPNSLVSMVNGMVNRLDPLKERQANKVIMDYIKNGKVIKDGDESSAEASSPAPTSKNNFPSVGTLNSWSFDDIKSYAKSLPSDQQKAFVDYALENRSAIAGGGAAERWRAEEIARRPYNP